MNDEFSQLLSEAGVSMDFSWQNVIVVQNYAGAPPPRMRLGIWPWDRGFNFVVLDRGTPRFFGKCRTAGDETLDRETMIRACLAKNRSGSLHVPPVWSAASDRIAVQVGPFIQGTHYRRVAPRQSQSAYLTTLKAVLCGAGELADFAQSTCDFLAPESPVMDLRESAEGILESVAPHVPLDNRLLSALAAALSAAGPVPSRPQHVDLWHLNILIGDGRLWAIDLEDYGTVHCPLYDDLTFLRSSLELRSGYSSHGIERLTGSGAEAVACREILARRVASEGLDLSQLDGVVAYYVSHRAATVARRAGVLDARQYFDDVRHVAERLASGARGLLSPG